MFSERSFFDAYDIKATLGRGNYSVVYHAIRHASLDEVAIKVWPTAAISSARERDLIRQEFEALAQLQHPHILPILEVGVTEKIVFIVSEYAPQGSLNTELVGQSHAPFAFERTMRIVHQVGQALHYAHQHHVTHGNLTPYNVLFNAQHDVLLADFFCSHLSALTENYTSESASMRWYMAPELARGSMSPFSDQYALGCLAYELFTGTVPFSGTARGTLLQKHLSDLPTDLSLLNAAIPFSVERAVLKALAKDPEMRHRDVEAFLTALGKFEPQPASVFTAPLSVEEESPFQGATDGPQFLPTEAAYLPDENTLEYPQLVPVDTAEAPTEAISLGPSQLRRPPMPTNRRSRRVILPILLIAFLVIVGSALLIPALNIFALHSDTTQAVVASPTQEMQASPSVSTPGPTSTVAPTPTLSVQPGSPTPTVIATIQPTPVPQLAPTNPPQSTVLATPVPTATSTVPTPTPTVLPITKGPVVQLTPVCIVKMGGGNFLAKFGYINTSNSDVTISRGSRNKISPSWENGQQPTVFSPGEHDAVLQIYSSYSGENITWTLDGSSMTANSHSPSC
jgi:serine/threonine protein kinase